MKKLLGYLILALSLGSLSCVETFEQKLQRIEDQLDKKPDEKGTKKILDEIVSLLLEKERQESISLGQLIPRPDQLESSPKEDVAAAGSAQINGDTETDAATNLEPSLENASSERPLGNPYKNRWVQSFSDGGTTFAWLETNHLVVRTGKETERHRTPEHIDRPSLNISSTGRYMTLLAQEGNPDIKNETTPQTDTKTKTKKQEKEKENQKKCPVYILENSNHPAAESSNPKGFRKFPFPVSCASVPVLTDDGSRFYYEKDGHVQAAQLRQSLDTGKKIIDKTALQNPNKKIPAQIILQQVREDDLIVFYGSSGNYHLYFYDHQKKEKPKKLSLNSALPYLFVRGDIWPTEYKNLGIHSQANPQKKAYLGNGFFITGKTKEYRQASLQIENWQAFPLFNTPASEFSFYAPNIHRFFQLIRGQLSIYDPVLKQRTPLPIKALWVGPLQDEGLLSIRSSDERIFLRSNTFTETEIKLLQVYHREIQRIN